VKNDFSIICRCFFTSALAKNCSHTKWIARRSTAPSDYWARTTDGSNSATIAIGNECCLSSMLTWSASYVRQNPTRKTRRISGMKCLISYYVRCAYNDTLSSYYFRHDEDIAWFAWQLNDLAHRVKNIVSTNVSMETLSKQQWEAYRSATRCHICEKSFAPDDPQSLSFHR